MDSLRAQFGHGAKTSAVPPPTAHSLTIDLNTHLKSSGNDFPSSNGVTADLEHKRVPVDTMHRQIPLDLRSHMNGVLDSHIQGLPNRVSRNSSDIHGLSRAAPSDPATCPPSDHVSPPASHHPSSPYSMSPRRRSPQSMSPRHRSAYSSVVDPLSPRSSSAGQRSPFHMSGRDQSLGDASRGLPFHMCGGDMSLSLQLSNTTSPDNVSQISSDSSSPSAISPRQRKTINSAMSPRQQEPSVNGFLPSAMSPNKRTLTFPNDLSAQHQSLPTSNLASLSSPDIKKLAVQLQEEVHNLSIENDKFKTQLNSVEIFREVPGANENDFTDRDDIEKLLQEVRFLRSELLSRDTELDHLKHLSVQKHSGSDGDSTKGQNAAHYKKQVQKLKLKLREAESVRNLLEEQISVDTRTEDNPSGFNPVLIVQMASEIDRLKQKLAQVSPRRQSSKRSQSLSFKNSHVQTNETKDRDVQTHHSHMHHTQECAVQTHSQMINARDCGIQTHHVGIHHSKDTQTYATDLKLGDQWLAQDNTHGLTSRIPRLKKSLSKESCSSRVDSSPDGQDTIKHLLRNTRLQVDELKSRLLSTEGTVRYQSKKIKQYRRLLDENGLLTGGLARARSESDLAACGASQPILSDVRATSLDDLNTIAQQADPSDQCNYDIAPDVHALKKQIKDLKKQLERYHQLLGLHQVQKQSAGTAISSPPRGLGGSHSTTQDDVRDLKNKNCQLLSDLHELKMNNAELQTDLLDAKNAKNEEVNMLSQLLEDCQRTNTVLQARLASVVSDKTGTMSDRGHGTDAGSDKSDMLFQRKTFSDTWNTCSQISKWLEELGDFLGELVHSDQNSSTDIMRFSGFQQRLEHSRAIVQNLSASLQGELTSNVYVCVFWGRVTKG